MLDGVHEFWTVNDNVYPDVCAFADEYVRTHHLMVYSNCNKFYRKSIIDNLRLRFVENLDFGEDRLFNYDFLKECGRIETSSQIMLRYIQRGLKSQSSRHIPGYYNIIRRLHEAKMDCFLQLSKNTSEEEKLEFLAYDVSNETGKMIERFKDHPEKKKEILPLINKAIFDDTDDTSGTDQHFRMENWFEDPEVKKRFKGNVQGNFNTRICQMGLSDLRKNPGFKPLFRNIGGGFGLHKYLFVKVVFREQMVM